MTIVGVKQPWRWREALPTGQQFGDERTKNLEKLQKSLGYTLATA